MKLPTLNDITAAANLEAAAARAADDPKEKPAGALPEAGAEDSESTPRERGRRGCDLCFDYDVSAKCLRRRPANVYRRAFSELKLLDILPEFVPGYSYHVISGGDVDSLSYLKCILRDQPLYYLLFSTWCMADDDVLQIAEWLEAGRLKRIDAYVGEIFPGSYRKQYESLKEVITPAIGRVAVFRNHAKIYAGIGKDYAFAIESSANINTNPRAENTSVHIDLEAFKFYKDYYDGIKSFTRDYDDWKPYSAAAAIKNLPAAAKTTIQLTKPI